MGLDCIMWSTWRASLLLPLPKKEEQGKRMRKTISKGGICYFVLFVFAKLAQADKVSPAAWGRLVPLCEREIQGSELDETTEVVIRFGFNSLLMLGKNLTI